MQNVTSAQMKIKVSNKSFLYYLILIPFLYPRGFAEYILAYKLFFTAWLYASIALSFFVLVIRLSQRRAKLTKCMLFMFTYSFIFILITVFTQGRIDEGLQKLFVPPALCIVCALCCNEDKVRFIKCISDILIVSFVLGLTVFSEFFMGQYFSVDTLILFWGHVQVTSQVGLLGIWIGYMQTSMGSHMRKKGILLIVLSVLVMLTGRTSASIISLILLGLGTMVIYLFKKPAILRAPSGVYILGYVLMNIALLFFLIRFKSTSIYTAFAFLNSGRTFVWESALELIKTHLWTGYGAYGVKIQTFWTSWSGGGMNYAHNELLQRVLDGGILLAVVYLMMLFSYGSRISRMTNVRTKCVTNLCFVVVLFVMLFESVTEYYYVFILFELFNNCANLKFGEKNMPNYKLNNG